MQNSANKPKSKVTEKSTRISINKDSLAAKPKVLSEK
jgi:hypothetical protein